MKKWNQRIKNKRKSPVIGVFLCVYDSSIHVSVPFYNKQKICMLPNYKESILYFLDRNGCFKGNWNIFLTSINCRSDLLTDWPNKRAKTLNYYYRQWLARRNTASWSTHETDTIHSRSHTHGMGAGFFFKERKWTYTGAAFLWIFSLLLAPRLAVIINLWTGMSRDGTLSLWVRLVHH